MTHEHPVFLPPPHGLGSLLRRASQVAVGTVVGQGLVLLATPILARLYSPAEFGSLALLTTVCNIATAVACLRYDLAIPSAPTPDSSGLLRVAIGIAGATAILTALVLLAAGHLLGRIGLGMEDHPVLTGICVFLVGTYQATNAWLLARGRFGGVAWLRMAQGGGFCVLALFPSVGLLWSLALSYGGGLLGLRGLFHHRRSEAEAGWRETAIRYRDFPLLSLPGAVLDVCGYSVCVWVVAAAYGSGAAGNFSQVLRLTGAPLMLISLSVGQILLKQTADLAAHGAALRHLIHRILGFMAILATLGLLALWLVGPPLFSRLLGAGWNVDRRLIVSVGVAVFARACVSPLSTVLITLRRFGHAMTWQALYFCSSLIVLPILARRLAFESYLTYYGLHEAVFYGFYLMLIYRAMRLGRAGV
ncbi:MAG TPA: hypothetical protein VGM73_11700 [Candidatus Didemnitutus sp.]|jgi:O-antigen/teichoic acid export membrane protein